MTKAPFLGRQVLATAILAAPFIAWLFGAEAALIVMALTLSAGSYLLAGALDATPRHIHRWCCARATPCGRGARVMVVISRAPMWTRLSHVRVLPFGLSLAVNGVRRMSSLTEQLVPSLASCREGRLLLAPAQ